MGKKKHKRIFDKSTPIPSQRRIAENPWLARTAIVGLLAVTFLVYKQTFEHGFAYDDWFYITQNPPVQKGLTLESLRWAFTTKYTGLWNPLLWVSLMMDISLSGGMKPFMFHLTNTLLHIACTFLLFLFLKRATGLTWHSLFVAALFALHPLHVESVAWITERKDTLSGFFWMATLLAYVYYAENPKPARYAIVFFLFVLGLMSKPMVVTLPFVLLLLDYWPLSRVSFSNARVENAHPLVHLILEKIPLFAAAFVCGLITYASGSANPPPLASRIETALVGSYFLLVKTVWPTKLAVHYPHPGKLPPTQILAAIALLAVVSLCVLITLKKRKYMAVAWLWYLIVLAPVSGLVAFGPRILTADRYSYISLIGIFIMVVWGLDDLSKLASQTVRSIVLPTLALAVCILFSVMTSVQASFWKDNYTVWLHAAEVTEENDTAHYEVALELSRRGRLKEAIQHYSEALRINPKLVEARVNLGSIFLDQGDVDAALREFAEAVRLAPHYAKARNNMGRALLQKGRVVEAINECSAAVRLDPSSAQAHNNLACALVQHGNLDDAIPHYEQAIQIDSRLFEAYWNLASVYITKRDYTKAADYVRLAKARGGTPPAVILEMLRGKTLP